MRVVFTLCVSILTQTAMTAVSPMSGGANFRYGKTPPRPTGRQSNDDNGDDDVEFW